MRRIFTSLALLVCLSVLTTGCSLMQPAPEQTVNEYLRDEFRSGPAKGSEEQAHPTPYRVHGGVGPASSSP